MGNGELNAQMDKLSPEIDNVKLVFIYILMLSVTMIWGGSWPAGKIVSDSLPAIPAAFFRFTIAVPVFFLAAIVMKRKLKIPRSLHPRIAFLGLLQITLYNYFYFTGLSFTSASDATLIISINPTLTAIFASFIYLDEKLTLKRLIGLLTALSGVILIFLESPNTDVKNRLLGDTIIFVAALTWATFTVLSRSIYKKVDPISFSAWGTFYGWLALVLIMPFYDIKYFNLSTFTTLKVDVIYAIIFLAVFSAAYGNINFNNSVKYIGPSRAAIFVNLVPIFGIFFSILLLHEKFSYIYLISLILIILGITIVNRSRKKIIK